MPLTSMTGFAREAGAIAPFRWAWELKSVNGRTLDVRLRTPPGYDAVGEAARRKVGSALKRGSVQIGLTVTRDEAAPRVRINEDALRSLLDALARIPAASALPPPTLDGLLAVRGIVETADDSDDQELQARLEADMLAGFDRALAALATVRESEGQALQTVLSAQVDRIAELTGQADAHPSRTADAVRQRLAAQVAALLDTGHSLDPARLHQEAVLMAAKADIREELDRLRAHVAAARALVAEPGPNGRKLDFLAQEFGRESNTLCAKANDVALSAIGLELKAVVEQFREQVQNVE